MSITILIHSSKTMRSTTATSPTTVPQLIEKVRPLAAYIQTLAPAELQVMMGVSESLSQKVHDMWVSWNADTSQQSLAIDSFIGDIYSGLRASSLSAEERDYAQQALRILSGLYGVLRPYNGVRPYRLEMGYKLPDSTYKNLYKYWGKSIVETLPSEGLVVNLSAVEYTKTVLPYIDSSRVVSPRFLTINPKTNKPTQVIVHTKIARGSFARWLIQSRITTLDELKQFADLNYHYEPSLSTAHEPTFVCKTFGGIGLSMRLEKV